MPPAARSSAPDSSAASPSCHFVWGDDDFAVKRRARQIFDGWTQQNPGGDTEIIDGAVGNTDEAMRSFARLREALNTLPFFGGPKSIWWRDCNFMGEDRVSEAQGVVAALGELSKELAAFRWDGVRLLVSAGKIDRRRAFAKGLEKYATVEHFPGLSSEDRDWREKAETLAMAEFRSLGKRPSGEALAAFVEQVGAHARQLAAEAQKLAAYVGDRAEISLEDVEAIVTRGKHARAFALGDAVGERQLARALKHLDEELWLLRSDKQKSEIGLLYGLISKVRGMLLAKELLREGWIRPGGDYRGFTSQLANVPADRLPTDKRYSPLAMNPFVLFRAVQHSANFTADELVAAMEELLRCNRRLVGSGLEGALVLQMAITRILSGPAPGASGGTRPTRSAETSPSTSARGGGRIVRPS